MKMLEHCIVLYDRMLQESSHREDGLQVWVGRTTKIMNDLNISNSYYSRIFGKMKDMGCIEQVQRGGGTAPSVYLLHHPPSIDAYNQASVPTDSNNKRLFSSTSSVELEIKMKHLRSEFEELESRFNAIAATVKAMAEKVDVEVIESVPLPKSNIFDELDDEPIEFRANEEELGGMDIIDEANDDFMEIPYDEEGE